MVDEFLEFEREQNLFSVRILGTAFWPLIREELFFELQRQVLSTDAAHSKFSDLSLWEKARQGTSLLLNGAIGMLKREKTPELLIVPHPRRVLSSGVARCIYSDAIKDSGKFSYLTFGVGSYAEAREKLLDPEYFYGDTADLKFAATSVLKKIFHRYVKISTSDQDFLTQIAEQIEYAFNVQISGWQFAQDTHHAIAQHNILLNQYKKSLGRIKPGAVFEVIGYERRRKALNAAAKAVGIPTVEMQHGIIGKDHIAYNFGIDSVVETFPDYLFLFGRFWKDNIRAPIPADRMHVVGWPYLENATKRHALDEATVKDSRREKVILFLSQGTIGRQLSQLAAEVAPDLQAAGYQIVYKLHPGEYSRWRIEYPWLHDKNINVIDNNSHDLAHYLSRASIQIGAYSTAIYEGLAFGLQTFIVKLPGYERMYELVSSGGASVVKNATELINLILTTCGNDVQNLSYFWEQDSLNKTVMELRKIISRT